MKEIICFQTEDGKVFQDEAKAAKHAERLKLQTIKKEFVTKVSEIFVEHGRIAVDALTDETGEGEDAEYDLAQDMNREIGGREWECLEDFADDMFDHEFVHFYEGHEDLFLTEYEAEVAAMLRTIAQLRAKI